MDPTNSVGNEDFLDEVPTVDGFIMVENEKHKNEDCGYETHPDCRENGELILPIHRFRKCTCKQYHDQSELLNMPLSMALSRVKATSDGYQIIKTFSCGNNSHRHTIRCLQSKKTGTPGRTSNQVTNEIRTTSDHEKADTTKSKDLQHRAQYIRKHAGIGG